jgi:hypothetical protein
LPPSNASLRPFATVQLVLWTIRLSVIGIVLFLIAHSVGGL